MSRATCLLMLTLGLCPGAARGGEKPTKAVVKVKEAKVMMGRTVVAVVARDTWLDVVKRKGEWLAVTLTRDGKKLEGWVRADHVILLADHPAALGKKPSGEWKKQLPAFSAALADVIKSAKIPTRRDLLGGRRPTFPFTNETGQPVWIVDQSPPKGTLQAELSRVFTGAAVRWRGEVEKVEKATDQEPLKVIVKLPQPERLRKNTTFPSALTLTVPAGLAKNIPNLKPGRTVLFKCRLTKGEGGGILEPVWALYGVGPNAGKVKVGLTLPPVEDILVPR